MDSPRLSVGASLVSLLLSLAAVTHPAAAFAPLVQSARNMGKTKGASSRATMSMTNAVAEETVVICGGGIVGASIAYHLTLRGVKPIVVEREKIAAAASGKAGGFLAGGWGSGPTTRMHEVSFDMHEQLAKTLNIESYRKIPTLSVRGEVPRAGDNDASWLDKKCRSSIMDEDTAQVTPLEITSKLMKAAEEKGATVKIGKVTGVQMEEGEGSSEGKKLTAVMVDGEALQCDKMIVSMGPWSGPLAEDWFDLPGAFPMDGVKSTSLVYKDRQDVAAEPYALFCGEDSNSCHLEVYPRPNGEVYICGCGGSDYVNGDRLRDGGDCADPSLIKPDPKRVAAASRSFSGMTSQGDGGPDVTQSCMRPCPPDGLPIMGAIPGVDGAYMSAGHNCWGILWGPVTGLLMSELLVDGKASTVDIGPFTPQRFMKKVKGRGKKRGGQEAVGEQW